MVAAFAAADMGLDRAGVGQRSRARHCWDGALNGVAYRENALSRRRYDKDADHEGTSEYGRDAASWLQRIFGDWRDESRGTQHRNDLSLFGNGFMRLDVSHPDSKRYEAYCDGHLLRHCVSADTDAGVALVYEPDENGQIARSYVPDGGGYSPVTRKVHGHIEIRKKQGFWADDEQ